MKLISQIDKHEMQRRWAIGEVYVDFIESGNAIEMDTTLKLLKANDVKKQKEGIERTLKTHHVSLVDCIPEDAVWHIGMLEISKKEFNLLKTLPVPDLAMVTNHTYRVPYAATIVNQNKQLNPRISQIMNELRKDKNEVQLLGITLLAKDTSGPFTIIEGNGRLISLYQVLFNEGREMAFQNNELEVAIGISDNNI